MSVWNRSLSTYLLALVGQVLSRKLTQRYFRGSLYMETDVEVGSSVAAESVVRYPPGEHLPLFTLVALHG